MMTPYPFILSLPAPVEEMSPGLTRPGRGFKLPAREAAVKKLLFVAAAVAVLAGAASSQVWFKGTVDEAVAKAKAEAKLVLVDFYSDG
jgi:hypothetical protein